MAFCPRCAAPNIDNAVTCAACGSPLGAAPGTAPGAVPPTGAPPPYGAPVDQSRMNGLAIAGFVLSFFGCLSLVGLILSIIAYNQCKKSNGMLRAEGFAL